MAGRSSTRTGDFPVYHSPDEPEPAPDARLYCIALGCETELPSLETQADSGHDLLVCRHHYYHLTVAIRTAIRNSYKRATNPEWVPTLEYCDAAEGAIRRLAKKEGRRVTGREEVLVELAEIRARLTAEGAGKEGGANADPA